MNTESFEELADTAAVLRQQWELSTDQLQDTGQAFLDFAKITRQKAEPATKALSLALKGFGRDVEDVGIVSDTLIASQQRFGISTAETTRILGENAGTFAALGLSMEDAIALLSALAANGVNTSRAVMGLRSSIDAFESPAEFQAALQDLAGIENATERAKAAMELFGAFGGPGLAKVMGEGRDALEQFKLSEEEVIGTTKRASEEFDKGIGVRLQLFKKRVLGTVVEMAPFAQSLGGVTLMLGTMGPAFSGCFQRDGDDGRGV